MLVRDLAFYQMLLHRLSLGELAALYERTMPDYAALGQAIAEEMDRRLSDLAA